MKLENFVKLWQIHEMCVSFSCFAFVSRKFAQILKYFAQSCDCMIAAFRNSVPSFSSSSLARGPQTGQHIDGRIQISTTCLERNYSYLGQDAEHEDEEECCDNL